MQLLPTVIFFLAESTTKDYITAKMSYLSPIYAAPKSSNREFLSGEKGRIYKYMLLLSLLLSYYLSALLSGYQTSRTLRSSNEKLLKIPRCCLKSAGESSFSFITPSVWTSLPASLRNLPTLTEFTLSSKLCCFDRSSQRSRWIMFLFLCVCELCIFTCVLPIYFTCEWCVQAL